MQQAESGISTGAPPGSQRARTHGITTDHLIRPQWRDDDAAHVTAEVERALAGAEDIDLALLVDLPRQRSRHCVEAIETIHRRLADYLVVETRDSKRATAEAEAGRRLRMWRRELGECQEALRRGLLAAQQLGLTLDKREHVLQLAIPDGYTHVSADGDLPVAGDDADLDPADVEAGPGGGADAE
jgi:hypothetical protein